MVGKTGRGWLTHLEREESVMSDSADGVRAVDCTAYLAGTSGSDEVCEQVMRIMCDDGLLALHDPRTESGLTDRVLDLVLRYFQQPEHLKKDDEQDSPEAYHQSGWTPPFTELPNPKHFAEALRLGLDPVPHPVLGEDRKERFFAPIGELPPYQSAFVNLNVKPVIPKGFGGEWELIIGAYGTAMKAAVWTFLEMLAVGFSLEKDFFTRWFTYGPHLFAPTGSDMIKHGAPGTVLAGVHRDIGGVSIHGSSNLAGLLAWLRNGRRIKVRVPKGYFLIQAAQQLEWLTGGKVLHGFHEVVALEEVQPMIAAARANSEQLWRGGDTGFFHMTSDEESGPKGPFATDEALARYPPITAGKQVLQELGIIGL